MLEILTALNKVVVFDSKTKEVLAVICENGESICRNDIDFVAYSESTEPVLTEINGKVYYNETRFMLKI